MTTSSGSGLVLPLIAALILINPPVVRPWSYCGEPAQRVSPRKAKDTALALERKFQRDSHHFTLGWIEDFKLDLGQASLGDFTFNESASWFHPQNAWVRDAALHIRVSRRGSINIRSDRRYVGAEYDREGPQIYGRFLARMRPSAPPGVVASFFTQFIKFDATYTNLLEQSEIDIEFAGTTRAVQFTLHWIDASGQKRQIGKTVPLPFDASQSFHTWEIEWVTDRVAFYVDGKELHRFSDPEALAELHNPQKVKANLWVSSSVPWVGALDERSLPVESIYDWLAVYRMDD